MKLLLSCAIVTVPCLLRFPVEAQPLAVQPVAKVVKIIVANTGCPYTVEVNAAFVKVQQLRAQGLTPQAVETLNAERQRIHGRQECAVSEAVILNDLGLISADQGQVLGAEHLLRESLVLLRQDHRSESSEAATTLDNLATVLIDERRYSQASEALLEALEIHRRVHGEQRPETARALNNLGLVYRNRKQPDLAEDSFRRALAIREKVLGPSDPDVAVTLNNLAVLLQERKRWSEAESMLQRSLAILEAAYGPQHPYVAATLNNLGVLYAQQKKSATAEPFFRRALSIALRMLPPGNPSLNAYRLTFAQFLRRTGRKKEAARLEKVARSEQAKHDRINLIDQTVDVNQLGTEKHH